MKIVYFIIISFIMISCSPNSSEKFLGTWKSSKENALIIVSKSGKNFIVETQNFEYFKTDSQIPATFDDKNDRLIISNGIGSFDIVINDNTKKMLFGGYEFDKQ